jgi:hypothetical protein
MRPREAIAGVCLAIAGLAAAVTIGLAAKAISSDSVGRSAEPLRAGSDALAPRGERDDSRSRERGERTRTRTWNGRGEHRQATMDDTTPATPAPPVVGHLGDDGGGSGSDDDWRSSGHAGNDDSSGHGGGGDDD